MSHIKCFHEQLRFVTRDDLSRGCHDRQKCSDRGMQCSIRPFTAIKVGVPNLETDLFTNVNKSCPSCDTWSAQAGKLLGNVHMCPSQCPICACPVYKLGHSLYTGATAWTLLVH